MLFPTIVAKSSKLIGAIRAVRWWPVVKLKPYNNFMLYRMGFLNITTRLANLQLTSQSYLVASGLSLQSAMSIVVKFATFQVHSESRGGLPQPRPRQGVDWPLEDDLTKVEWVHQWREREADLQHWVETSLQEDLLQSELLRRQQLHLIAYAVWHYHHCKGNCSET